MSCIWTIISNYYNNLQKQMFKNSFEYEKVIVGQRDMQSFSKVMLLVHFISFAPHMEILCL
jgi:hypothetical protein